MQRMEKEYIPLSGAELLDYVLTKARTAMKTHNHRFGPHVSYHNPKIELALRVQCFTPEGVPDVGGFEQVFDLGEKIMEPDRAREEVGIGTYETKQSDDSLGIIIDEKAKPSTSETVEKVNKLIEEAEKKPKKKMGWPKGKPRKAVPTQQTKEKGE